MAKRTTKKGVMKMAMDSGTVAAGILLADKIAYALIPESSTLDIEDFQSAMLTTKSIIGGVSIASQMAFEKEIPAELKAVMNGAQGKILADWANKLLFGRVDVPIKTAEAKETWGSKEGVTGKMLGKLLDIQYSEETKKEHSDLLFGLGIVENDYDDDIIIDDSDSGDWMESDDQLIHMSGGNVSGLQVLKTY